MGWVDEHEQQEILLAHRKRADHRCNACKKPIFVNQLFSVDPKGGYFKKEPDAPTWFPSRPKVTYHLSPDCDPVLARRQSKKVLTVKQQQEAEENVLAGSLKKVAKAVLELLTNSRKKQYWKKTIVVRSLKNEYKAALIRKALRAMLAQGVLKKNGRYLSPVKKHKGER